MYFLQWALLNAPIQFFSPLSISGIWWQKTHMTGWVQVDRLSTEYDAHWLFCMCTISIFVFVSAYLDVYRRIKYMEDLPEIEK